MVLLIASETSAQIMCNSSVSGKGKVGNEKFPRTHNFGERTGQVWRDNCRRVLTPPGGGEGTAIYGLYSMCHCEWYGFQAVYSGIGYINQRVWV